MRSSRRYVTLFEILIVMAIIVMISGIVTVSFDKALVDQRFRNEVSMIVDDLRLAQDLMMILGADVKIKFTTNKETQGIKYELETATEINESLKYFILNKPRVLSTIRGLFFEDELENQNIEGAIVLQFFSRGAVMSRGVIRVSISGSEKPPEGILENYIYLPGYPAPITSIDRFDVSKSDHNALEDQNFNKTVTESTFALLSEKIKAPPPPTESPIGPDPKKKGKEDVVKEKSTKGK